MPVVIGGAVAALVLVTGCTSNTAEPDEAAEDSTSNAGSSNDDTGETVTIGFSGPEADHGWLAAVNSAALEEAEKYDDVELRAAEGTNDASLQISQIETFINEDVDAIVMLPTDGAALTDVATKAMEAGTTPAASQKKDRPRPSVGSPACTASPMSGRWKR